jgi:thioester reductase-like protein
LWDPRHGPCPEDTLNDLSVAMGGYGQSKYVAEQVYIAPFRDTGNELTRSCRS